MARIAFSLDDATIAQIRQTAADVDAEIREIRSARRAGGRRHAAE